MKTSNNLNRREDGDDEISVTTKAPSRAQTATDKLNFRSPRFNANASVNANANSKASAKQDPTPPSKTQSVAVSNPHNLPTVVFVVGPPGSGKTTLAKQLVAKATGTGKCEHLELTTLLDQDRRSTAQKKGFAMVSSSHHCVSVVAEAIRARAQTVKLVNSTETTESEEKKQKPQTNTQKKLSSENVQLVGAGGLYLVEGFPRNDKEWKIWQHSQEQAHAFIDKIHSKSSKTSVFSDNPALCCPTVIVVRCPFALSRDRFSFQHGGEPNLTQTNLLKMFKKRQSMYKSNEGAVVDILQRQDTTQIVNNSEDDHGAAIVSVLTDILTEISPCEFSSLFANQYKQ